MTKYRVVFSLGMLVGLCVWLIASVTTRTGDWKPSGDGRTVVNTKTGEICVTATGETIQAYRTRVNEERTAQAAAEQKYRQQEETRQEADRQAEARQKKVAYAESARLQADAAEQSRKQQELADAEAAQRAAENGRHYHAIQIAILETSPREVYGEGEWWTLTSPFRADRFPTRYERDRFVGFLGDSLYRGVLFGPKWTPMQKHLESLVFDQTGEGTMTRTEQQSSESTAAMEAAKLRAQRAQ